MRHEGLPAITIDFTREAPPDPARLAAAAAAGAGCVHLRASEDPAAQLAAIRAAAPGLRALQARGLPWSDDDEATRGRSAVELATALTELAARGTPLDHVVFQLPPRVAQASAEPSFEAATAAVVHGRLRSWGLSLYPVQPCSGEELPVNAPRGPALAALLRGLRARHGRAFAFCQLPLNPLELELAARFAPWEAEPGRSLLDLLDELGLQAIATRPLRAHPSHDLVVRFGDAGPALTSPEDLTALDDLEQAMAEAEELEASLGWRVCLRSCRNVLGYLDARRDPGSTLPEEVASECQAELRTLAERHPEHAAWAERWRATLRRALRELARAVAEANARHVEEAMGLLDPHLGLSAPCEQRVIGWLLGLGLGLELDAADLARALPPPCAGSDAAAAGLAALLAARGLDRPAAGDPLRMRRRGDPIRC